jgi:ferric-dicitrate binding protein FerR (iron transport regulator)
VAGKNVNAYVVRGKVRVKLRGKKRFVELEAGQQIPVGTTVDTTKGRVTIVAAGDQQADFYDGIFKLAQNRAATPLTTLKLVEKLRCPRAGSALAAAKGRKKRRLWGDGSGKFKTRGKHSAATVVGTKWLVEDRCGSTLTRVASGRVRVRDFGKRKTVVVRAGKKYVAKAR